VWIANPFLVGGLMMLHISLGGARWNDLFNPRKVRPFTGSRLLGLRPGLSQHNHWAGHALHSHFFGQTSRNRFGRRGRTKG
jgi:hypothetical protein